MFLLFNYAFKIPGSVRLLKLNSSKSDSYDSLFNNWFSFLARRHSFPISVLGYLTFDQGRSYLAAKHEELFEQVEV
jgi:hypothetical protein